MDFKTLERLWASHENNLSQTAEAYLLEDLMNTLRNRRRKFYLWMVFVGIKLSAFTVLIAYIFLVQRDVAFDKTWVVPLLLVIPWIGFVVFKLQFHQHLRAFPGIELSMPQNLAALLDENHTTRQRARIIAIMHAVFAPFALAALWQLTETGKMTLSQATQAAMLFIGALLVSAIVQAIVYFGFTQPEGQRLQRLLIEYQA